MIAKKKVITLRVTNEMFSVISCKAKELGISVNAYITMILSKEMIEKRKRKL